MKKSIQRFMDPLRDQSWSQLSCFENPDYPMYSDKQKWYERYVLKIKEPPTQELIFGSLIDKKIQDDKKFLPMLKRFSKQQYKMTMIISGIRCVGYADQWEPGTFELADDKTGKAPWTQARADKTGQLTMYALFMYKMHGIRPEQINFSIRWLETERDENGKIRFVQNMVPKTFYTKRSMVDIVKFAKYIEETHKKMQAYCASR